MPKAQGSGTTDKSGAVESPLSIELLADEPRRSERVKRDKPDYYDALEFETKRVKTTAGSAAAHATGTSNEEGESNNRRQSRLGRPPKQAYSDRTHPQAELP